MTGRERPGLPPRSDAGPKTRRLDALRHLLHPHSLRSSVTLTRPPSLRNAGLAGFQAAAATAIALPLTYLSPWPHLIGFASLGALVALFGRFAPSGRRNRIVLYCGLIQVMAVLGMSLASWAGATALVQLVLLALACGLFFLLTVSGQFGAPGALIFVFAAGASMGEVESLQAVMERSAATAIVAALAWAICAATDRHRHLPTAERPFPDEPLRPLGHRLIAAFRIAIGAAMAILASYALGMDYPAWAAMGALAVMQGAHLHVSMHRALQRMAGTAVGAVFAWLILSQEPSVWFVILALVLLQIATELIIGANYGLGQILVTPMALMMTHLADPYTSSTAMASERVIDTLLGVAIGLCAAVLLSSLDDRHFLAHHHGRQNGER